MPILSRIFLVLALNRESRARLRKKVLDWLMEFEKSERMIVLDWEWAIIKEYKGENRRDKLTDQDYGMLLVLERFSTGKFLGVQLEWENPDRAKIYPPHLSLTVRDDADRKMVAAVLAAGSGPECNLINACDTDWYDWQSELEAEGIIVEQLIGDEWCFPKWRTKSER